MIKIKIFIKYCYQNKSKLWHIIYFLLIYNITQSIHNMNKGGVYFFHTMSCYGKGRTSDDTSA